jgi:hypothetical protein
MAFDLSVDVRGGQRRCAPADAKKKTIAPHMVSATAVSEPRIVPVMASRMPDSRYRAAVCAEREVCRLLDAPEDSLHDLPGATCHPAIVGQQVRGLPWAVAEQLGQAGQFPIVARQGI